MTPLLVVGGLEYGLKRPFSNFEAISSSCREFTAPNKCAYQIQHTTIFKIVNFQPGAKS